MFWNSLAFSMIQQMLAILYLIPLPFLNPAWTSVKFLVPLESIIKYFSLFLITTYLTWNYNGSRTEMYQHPNLQIRDFVTRAIKCFTQEYVSWLQLNSPPWKFSINIGKFLQMRTMSMKLSSWGNSKGSWLGCKRDFSLRQGFKNDLWGHFPYFCLVGAITFSWRKWHPKSRAIIEELLWQLPLPLQVHLWK